MPRDLNQVSYTLRRCAVVLVHALFQGPAGTNPFVESMWRLANTINDRVPVYLGEHQKLRGTTWYDVYPAHVIRHVQVNVYEYMQALQVHSGGICHLSRIFKTSIVCCRGGRSMSRRSGCRSLPP